MSGLTGGFYFLVYTFLYLLIFSTTVYFPETILMIPVTIALSSLAPESKRAASAGMGEGMEWTLAAVGPGPHE